MIVLIQAVIVGNFPLADRVNINVALLINIVAMVVLVLFFECPHRRREPVAVTPALFMRPDGERDAPGVSLWGVSWQGLCLRADGQ